MLRKKFRIFLLIILVTSVFSVILFSNSVKYESTIENVDDIINFYDLRVSGPQINITTPENITYTEPMSGYYPATYGFENDHIGDVPFGWTTFHDSSCSSLINSELGGHKNILRIYDNNGGGCADLYQTFPAKQNGTIEFWTRKESGDTTCGIIELTNRTVVSYCNVYIDYDYNNNGIFRYYNNLSQLTEFASGQYSDNTWMHIRIDFECGTGGYKGLSPDSFDLYLNGNKVISGERFWFDTDKITNIRLVTANARTGSFYIDALGYSWDPNYNTGDNLNEGLLLSFENNTSLDWIGYSLDGLANKTILGNVTFPYLSEGLHTIQVFGNNSIGTNFQSDIRHFSVKHIKIITPENKTYYGPMSGYHPATYGFENDENGVFPQGWTEATGNPSIINEIIAELDGHKKVLHMDKADTSGSDNHVVQFFDEAQEYGTIEFWGRTNDTSQENSWHLKSGTLNQFAICGIEMYNNSFAYWLGSGSGWQPVAYVANNNQWYHIKIQFECGTGNHYGLSQYYWRFFVNGVEFGDYAIISSQSDVSHINIHQNWAYANFHTYTDAIGYSWDPNYNIGDNLNEGLLVSFDLGFIPDWIGYSLDGQTTRTILGNTTIPIPADGLHTIQVFGNNSIGTMYQSDKRYFTIGEIPIDQPGIPGYQLIIIIGVISIVSAILVKKKFK